MSAKDFLFRFLAVIGAGMLITLFFTYLEIKKYNVGDFIDTPIDPIVLHRSNSGQNGGNQNNTGQSPSSISDTWAPPENKLEEKYPVDEYPVSFSATGSPKLIGATSILLTTESGEEVDAIVTGSTEVFLNGERAEITAIDPGNNVTIIGRKQSKDGSEFVADTIYANYVPVVGADLYFEESSSE